MLEKFRIIIAIIPLLISGCKGDKYDNIQITFYKNKDVIKIISNYETIAYFEKAVRMAKKVEYIKDSDDYNFSIFCKTNKEVDYFSIRDNYILSKKGLYVIDEDLENILGIKSFPLARASRSSIKQK